MSDQETAEILRRLRTRLERARSWLLDLAENDPATYERLQSEINEQIEQLFIALDEIQARHPGGMR